MGGNGAIWGNFPTTNLMSTSSNSKPIFSGEFRHALDGKSRVTIPSAWRSGEADEFFLMPGQNDTCVRAMPPDEYRAVAERAKASPGVDAEELSIFLRHFYSRAHRVTTDKQGRLVLPEEFCKNAALTGEIMLVGVLDHFEIWSRETWDATKENEKATFRRVSKLAGLL